MSSSQFSVMSLIEANPGIRIVDLAKTMVMERTTLVRALKPLQIAGWVVGENAGARGAAELSLSVVGNEKFSNALPYWEAAQREYEGQVGEDRATLLRNTALDIRVHE
jgi:DNA-binding MarR family transcriptional regulator